MRKSRRRGEIQLRAAELPPAARRGPGGGVNRSQSLGAAIDSRGEISTGPRTGRLTFVLGRRPFGCGESVPPSRRGERAPAAASCDLPPFPLSSAPPEEECGIYFPSEASRPLVRLPIAAHLGLDSTCLLPRSPPSPPSLPSTRLPFISEIRNGRTSFQPPQRLSQIRPFQPVAQNH